MKPAGLGQPLAVALVNPSSKGPTVPSDLCVDKIHIRSDSESFTGKRISRDCKLQIAKRQKKEMFKLQWLRLL